MTYKPPYIVFDYESEECGEASTEMYRPGFYVSSCAFCWRGQDGKFKTHYIDGPGTEKKVAAFLLKCVGIPLIVYNLQFEWGVTICRLRQIADKLGIDAFIDVMRLVQNYDNGGGEFQFMPLTYDEQLDYFLNEFENGESDSKKNKKKPTQKFIGGLGLKNAAMRILGVEDHKKKAHEWLRENVDGCRKGNEGSYLHMLPEEIMRDYNIADVITTARLYEHCTAEFKRIGFDWTVDHGLYRSTVRHIVEAKIEGVRVEREQLASNIGGLREEVRGIELGFAQRFAAEIRSIERDHLYARVTKLKTFRGRKSYLKRFRADNSPLFADEIQFNVGSNKQLEELFVGKLRIEPRFLTETGKPAFRSAVLDAWGDGGILLKTRRKRLLVLKQSEALLKLSEFDGFWHIDIKVAGTATSRLAGGSASG